MKLGAEPKKVAILAGLVLVAAYFLLTGQDAPPGAPAGPVVARPAVPDAVPLAPAAAPKTTPGIGPRTPARQFKPALKTRKPEAGPDPLAADPTLRLDLLAKVQSVQLEGVARNLFQFGAAPLPKTPEPKVIPRPLMPAPSPAAANSTPMAPPKPPPPPIPLKFYGYSSRLRPNEKRAFFLDGEEIVVAGEGELIRKRYKVVRIGINSAVVEDVEHHNEQTLRLEEPAG